MSKTFSLVSSDGRRNAEIVWDSTNKSVDWFKVGVRDAFNIAEGFSFLLLDMDGGTCVISTALPSGTYAVLKTDCVETIGSIISRADHHHTQRSTSIHLSGDAQEGEGDISSRSQEPENFEQNLLRIACADAMISNERTFLAWTRTALAIMMVCFTFTLLDDWSIRPKLDKILSNLSVVMFAFSFLGCFLVGYVRYRMFARLLRTSAFSSSFSELDVDWSRSHLAWVVATGVTLAFAGLVYLGVLKVDDFDAV